MDKVVTVGIILSLGLAILLVRASAPHLEAQAQFRQAEIEAAKESIALSLMGQLRLAAADLMWMKTLEYLHNGVALRMPTKAEKEKGYTAREADTPAGLSHKDGVTVVPDKKRDWRGFVGDLHRHIAPMYFGKIHHSDPKELIPWYRLALKFNPHLERLYTLGAFFMADFARAPDEARELLEVGIETNPWSSEIHGSLGRLYYDNFEEYEKAVKMLEKAIELGKKEREKMAKNKEKFDEYREYIFKDSYLYLARSLTELGRYDEAIEVCEEGLKETGYHLLEIQKRIIGKRRDGKRSEGLTEESGALRERMNQIERRNTQLQNGG